MFLKWIGLFSFLRKQSMVNLMNLSRTALSEVISTRQVIAYI